MGEFREALKAESAATRNAIAEQSTILASLHQDFLLRSEADKIATVRDKERDEILRHLGHHDKRISKLEYWRAALAGGVAVVIFLLGLIASASHGTLFHW
jgi:hypothetical protein